MSVELWDERDDLDDEFLAMEIEEEELARELEEEQRIIELNDFKDNDDYNESPDESEERYNNRVFKNGMKQREKKLEEVGIMLFDPTQIEGVLDAKNKKL